MLDRTPELQDVVNNVSDPKAQATKFDIRCALQLGCQSDHCWNCVGVVPRLELIEESLDYEICTAEKRCWVLESLHLSKAFLQNHFNAVRM